MKKWKFVRRIRDIEIIPPFYGIVWRDMCSRETVCVPLGFNVLARLLRNIYIWARLGWFDCPVEPRDAYLQGIEVGMKRMKGEGE